MEISDKLKSLAKDLRKDEPRPAHEELGGEQYAARALDKCRASLVGLNGDYTFGCPMDQHFFSDTGIKSEDFQKFVATGATDQQVAEWIEQHARTQRR
jgi:hypothetical protein